MSASGWGPVFTRSTPCVYALPHSHEAARTTRNIKGVRAVLAAQTICKRAANDEREAMRAPRRKDSGNRSAPLDAPAL